MKIIYICPGTGDAFYCENCIRDTALAAGLRTLGHEVEIIPMYLPVSMETHHPVMFGAVRLYLIDKFPILKILPDKILRLLDRRKILDMAAGVAGSTRAGGHEEMTVSIIEGENGKFAGEFEKTVDYLLLQKPDVVVVPNGFLIGMLSAVKAKDPNVRTVCFLQDEHVWVDVFAEKYRGRTWETIARKASGVDVLLTHSVWYRDKVAGLLGLSPQKIYVVPFGVDVGKSKESHDPQYSDNRPIVIGYLSRLCKELGVDVLVDAYCLLLERGALGGGAMLDLCGGYTGDDGAVIKSCRQKVSEAGGRVNIRKGFDINSRKDFLSGLSILAVPVRDGIAFGGFISEAMAAGVPVVMPDIGGFKEVVAETGAGLLYSPNTPEALADALAKIILDDGTRSAMSDAGRKAVADKYNHIEMARRVVGCF